MAQKNEISENQIKKAIKLQWDNLFPHLILLKEEFHFPSGKVQCDLFAFNPLKNTFTIIEIKVGRAENKIEQAISYRVLAEREFLKIYKSASTIQDFHLPEITQMNEKSEIILIAPDFSERIHLLIDDDKEVILLKLKYHSIGKNEFLFVPEYEKHKPQKIKDPQPFKMTREEVNKTVIPEIKKSNKKVLKIEFSDGTIIQEKEAVRSFIEAIKKVGIENVKRAKIKYGNIPLLISSKWMGKRDKKTFLDEGYYLHVHHSTASKKKILDEISKKLKLKIKVILIEPEPSIDSGTRWTLKLRNKNFIKRIEQMSDTQIDLFTAEQRNFIIKRFS